MRWVWLTALVLAGCVQQEVYAPSYHNDYRSLLVEMVGADISKGQPQAPWSVVSAYAECSADFAVANVSPADLAKLDVWARQGKGMSGSELNAIDRRINESAGGDISYQRLDVLKGTCPDKIPLFKQYFKAI